MLKRALFILTALLLAAVPVGAQATDARVLPPGMIRVQGGGSFTAYSTRFGSVARPELAEREPLATEFVSVLTSLVYAPLQGLETDLNRVFAATADLGDAFQAGPANLFLHTAALHAAADQREAAFEIDLGVLQRVQVGVRVPIVQNWLGVRQFGVAGGTVGFNPDTAFNRALLEQLGPGLGDLGARSLLPTHNSPAGQELRRRVLAAGIAEEPRLPESPMAAIGTGGIGGVDGIELGRFDPADLSWEAGDTELRVRVQWLNTGGVGASPPSASVGYRGAVQVGVRLPTGTAPDAGYLVLPLPRLGLTGGYLRLDNDLFPSRRLGATATLIWETVLPIEIEQRVWEPAEGFPPESMIHTLRWEPGSRLSLAVTPRLRIVEEIVLVGRYRFARAGREAYVPLGPAAQQEEVIGTPITSHEVAAGIEFSTLASAFAGRGTIPFEVALYLRDTVGGSGGVADAQVIEAVARIYHPLWGRR